MFKGLYRFFLSCYNFVQCCWHFFIKILLFHKVSYGFAGWLDGWAQPAQLSQPSQPSPFETPETNKKPLKNQRCWSPTGFITLTGSGNKPGWAPKPLVSQSGWAPKPLVFQLFLLVSGVSNGLGWLGWLSWAGWDPQPASQPSSHPASQPASKTMRNLRKKDFHEKVPTTFNKLQEM